MAGSDDPEIDDPVVARLLRNRTGLRKGGSSAEHEVLATYWSRTGDRPFAICRHGLLIRPDADARYVPFVDVEDAGYHNIEMVRRAKSAKGQAVSEPLSIRLLNGEVIDLPVDVQDDGMPDLLTIASLIAQRVVIHRAEARRTSGD